MADISKTLKIFWNNPEIAIKMLAMEVRKQYPDQLAMATDLVELSKERYAEPLNRNTVYSWLNWAKSDIEEVPPRQCRVPSLTGAIKMFRLLVLLSEKAQK